MRKRDGKREKKGRCEMGKAGVEVGVRIFNRGDMANPEHFGTITKFIKSERFHDQVEITPDADTERKPYRVPAAMINEVDSGNGSTRIVTEKAYREYRERKIAEFKKYIKEM